MEATDWKQAQEALEENIHHKDYEKPKTYVRHQGDKRRHHTLGKPTPQGRRRGVRQLAGNRPHARFRSGLRTGTTSHFTLWMNTLALTSSLYRTKLLDLAEKRTTDARLAGTYALLGTQGIKNVLDLTRASRRDLLALKGIGEARLDGVKADLAARGVAVSF